MKLTSHWAPYLVAAGAIALAPQVAMTAAHASTTHHAPAPFTIRLEDQFLASLKYLPVTFRATSSTTTTTTTTSTTTTTTTVPGTPTTSSTSTTTTTLPPTTTTTSPAKIPTKIVPGTFVWRFPSLPGALRAQWQVGTRNVVLQGALMSFQLNHDLATTGQMDAATWKALTHAVIVGDDAASYNYVYVSKGSPETLKLYINGHVEQTNLVNTGVSDAPTANGTFPVYSRFTVTTMSGTMPDGTTYHDTGIPWVSYFNGGDALHGFIRASYGYPQSLGCVEMPFVDAGRLWPHTPIGTLVTVQ